MTRPLSENARTATLRPPFWPRANREIRLRERALQFSYGVLTGIATSNPERVVT